jgi:hypothetical protein
VYLFDACRQTPIVDPGRRAQQQADVDGMISRNQVAMGSDGRRRDFEALSQRANPRILLSIHTRFIFFITLGMALTPTWAQQAQEAVPSQSVQVVGVRDPAMLPYKTAHDILAKIAGASDGRVRVLIKVVSAESRQPFPDLHISLQGDDFFENVSVSTDGLVTVPISQAAYDGNAELLTNKKKGSLHVEIYLVPVLASDGMTYGDITASIDAARRAMRQLVPWYLRMLAPSIDSLGICYPDNGQSIAISRAAESLRAAFTEAKSPVTDAKVFCASFSSIEHGLTKDSIISPPVGWEAIFQ